MARAEILQLKTKKKKKEEGGDTRRTEKRK